MCVCVCVCVVGDFAVLLRSGMTVRQALTYNVVSSVLAFTGMCLGVVLAAVHWSTSSWVFALSAGIFLYVSLVDMVRQSPPPAAAAAAVSSLNSTAAVS